MLSQVDKSPKKRSGDVAPKKSGKVDKRRDEEEGDRDWSPVYPMENIISDIHCSVHVHCSKLKNIFQPQNISCIRCSHPG